jgi:hypothetical protein
MSSPTPPTYNGSRPAAEYGQGRLARLSSESIQRVVVLGFITAVAMPPIGFVLGLLLAVRLEGSDSKRGRWIIAVSVIAAILWVVTLATGVVNPNSNTST